VAGALLASVAARAEEPAGLCRRVGTDDTLRVIPRSLVPAVRKLFDLRASTGSIERTTQYRCMEGSVMVYNVGANLPCGKANQSRNLPAVDAYCRANPGASFVPAFVTGHDTIWRFACAGTEARAAGPAAPLDGRGFFAQYWRAVP
jgi:hypothetical protein